MRIRSDDSASFAVIVEDDELDTMRLLRPSQGQVWVQLTKATTEETPDGPDHLIHSWVPSKEKVWINLSNVFGIEPLKPFRTRRPVDSDV